MGLDLNRIRQKQAETTRMEGSFFRPEEGKNIIRLFSFEHKVTQADVDAKRFLPGERGQILELLDRPVIQHFNVVEKGPVISNPTIMREYNRLKISAKKEDQARADQIKPGKKYFLNVMDMNHPDEGMKLFGCPVSVYNKILAYLGDEEYGADNLVGPNGRDFVIVYDKKKSGTDKYSVGLRVEGKSVPLPGKVVVDALDLYSDEAYAQMGQVLSEDPGVANVTEEDVEMAQVPAKGKPGVVAEEEDVVTTTKAPVKKAAAPVVDLDEPEVEKKRKGAIAEEVEEIFGTKPATKAAPKRAAAPAPAEDEEVDLSGM